MLNLPEKIIILDTEYTAWPGSAEHSWNRPNEYKELVQIGAILADTNHFAEIDNINLFVKPVKNPALSDYFIDLTGIKQKDVDENGISLKEAVLKFSSWCDSHQVYSYGGDEQIIEENCKLLGIPFLLDQTRFKDIRDIFQNHGIPVGQYNSGSILEAFGKKTNLQNHNALNDVRILLDGLRELSAIVSNSK